MATNILPHNLAESIDAIAALIDDPDADVEKLSKYVKGPDFPTGATIAGRNGIKEAYRSGRGRIVMRARIHTEELRGEPDGARRQRAAVRRQEGRGRGCHPQDRRSRQGEGVLPEISDLADYLGKDGMRIQIELKRDAVPHVVLNKFFKHTLLRDDLRLQRGRARRRRAEDAQLARADPALLDYQREVVTRRSKYELRAALERAHVLEGYVIALDNFGDAVNVHIRHRPTRTRPAPASWSSSASPRFRHRPSSTCASSA